MSNTLEENKVKYDAHYKEHHRLLNNLILFNKAHRKHISPELKKNMLSSDFCINCCTVRFNAGRWTGKNEYIKQNADKTSLLIVDRVNVGKNIFPKSAFTILSARQIINGSVDGMEIFKNIYIKDPTSIFRIISKEKLYSKLSFSEKDQTFILLGE